MPMLKLSKDYIFKRPDGRNVCLPNLFAGKRQLVIYQYATLLFTLHLPLSLSPHAYKN